MKQITKQLLKSANFVERLDAPVGFIESVCSIKNHRLFTYSDGKTREQAYRNFYRLIAKIEGGEC